ncbi:uncharacterized protein LOC114293238 [Camellia sinensis]|uniref:uncharacterized protein LOC114293238 n=1 Tax=Camellia sinensis TaxID=4442 RepID=UPI001036A107|nr:uncharacterized protein LOC114293238 [Camellia sinensis]
MNKVFAAFWYSGILPLLSCTTTTTTTTFENHESLSRPQSAKKAGTKAKQNSKQNREKDLEKKDGKKKCFPQWRKSKKEKDQQPMSPYLALRLLEEGQLKKKKEDLLEPKTSMEEKTCIEARLRAERTAVDRATKLSRLNTAVDETTKVQDSGVFVTEKGECASSLLTEEPQQEVLEMDRLEAELESELQKLLGCSTEASGFEGKIPDICENEDASFEGFYKPDGQTSDSCQLSEVLPSELDQKLSICSSNSKRARL